MCVESVTPMAIDINRHPLVCFVVILSASGRDRQQDGVRQTWVRHKQSDWDYKFFVGGDGDRTLADIVWLPDVDDDHAHLSHKMLGALKWVLTSVQTQFVLKVDEDTWVDMSSMIGWLHAHGSGWFYGGTMQKELPVYRSGKWGVPTSPPNASKYPPYALGGGYVMSLRAAAAVIQVLDTGQVPLIPNVEDGSVGLAAHFLGLRPAPITGFRQRRSIINSQLTSGCCSVGTLLYHKPSDMRICEQCSSLPHTAATTAVCLVGEPRSIALTAQSLRQHLLESVDADAFVVAISHNASAEHLERDMKAMRGLGPRVRFLRLGSAEDLLDAHVLQQVANAPAHQRSYHVLQQVADAPAHQRSYLAAHSAWPRRHAEQWLTRQACADIVHEVENKRGWPYSVYGRVRLDTQLFAPLGKALVDNVTQGRNNSAIVPVGNEFGAHPYLSVNGSDIMHVTDKMLIGGRRAFDADASIWRTVISSSVRPSP